MRVLLNAVATYSHETLWLFLEVGGANRIGQSQTIGRETFVTTNRPKMSSWDYRGTSLITKRTSPYAVPTTLGLGLR